MGILHAHREKTTFGPAIAVGLLIVVVLAFSTVPVQAQEVLIKRSFFSGWQYSTDGATFSSVGSSASDLREVMAEHRVCISALNSYRAHSAASKMTGLTSAFLITFPLVSNAIAGEWSDGSTPMILVGLGFGVLSLSLDASGSGSLKHAVRLYNRYEGRRHALMPDIQPTRVSDGMQLSFGMKF